MRKPVETRELGTGTDDIEHLKLRYDRLHKQKITADTHLEVARTRLEELQEEARRLYGTDDVAELQKKLVAMKAENDRKRSDYQAELDRIESDLATIEREFAEVTEG
jgi:predicted  nucleic acid-binding Zn-ribbon protein